MSDILVHYQLTASGNCRNTCPNTGWDIAPSCHVFKVHARHRYGTSVLTYNLTTLKNCTGLALLNGWSTVTCTLTSGLMVHKCFQMFDIVCAMTPSVYYIKKREFIFCIHLGRHSNIGIRQDYALHSDQLRTNNVVSFDTSEFYFLIYFFKYVLLKTNPINIRLHRNSNITGNLKLQTSEAKNA